MSDAHDAAALVACLLDELVGHVERRTKYVAPREAVTWEGSADAASRLVKRKLEEEKTKSMPTTRTVPEDSNIGTVLSHAPAATYVHAPEGLGVPPTAPTAPSATGPGKPAACPHPQVNS